ncbi:MAG: QueT transporter family protein [Blautia sp.]|nr:QueT transporter family protein [Blautia sp.]
MKNKGTLFLTQGAMIAAVYVVLTLIFAPVSFGEVQVRVSEALTILPYFTPAAIPGLFVGCIIGNITGGGIPVDIIFGSLATLLGAVGTYLLRKKNRFLAPIPPILANAVIVPFVLYYGYGINLPIPLMMLTVGAGEVISAGVLGIILQTVLMKYAKPVFRQSGNNLNADRS